MTLAIDAATAMLDRQRDQVLGLLQAVVALQADGETAVQSCIADRLAAAGAAVKTLRFEPAKIPMVDEFAAAEAIVAGERASIVGHFPGVGGGRSLLLFAHPDSEPVPGTTGWSRDPFTAIVENGRLYGWGVADDLAGVTAMVSAMQIITAAGIRLAGSVTVASTPSKRHARGVTAVLLDGHTADAALYLHPAESGVGMHEIKAFASGQLEFMVEVSGRAPATSEPGHAAWAHTAINPLDLAMPLFAALRQLDAERGARVHHPLLEAEVGRSSNLMVSGVSFGVDAPHSRLSDRLVFSGAISFPPQETLAAVQAEIVGALAAAAAGHPWLVDHPPVLRWVSGVSGMQVEDTHPLFVTVSDAVQRIGGYVPHVNPMHTSSDIRNPLVQKGIPTVGLGPLCGDLTQSGGHDEWVDVEDYLRAIKVVMASIIDWCGISEPHLVTNPTR